MKIQFDDHEQINVTRSPYCSDERLVIYIAPNQIALDNLVDWLKSTEVVRFYVNDDVLATYSGYVVFNSLMVNDSELTVTLVNPNPERDTTDVADYIEAVNILLGEEG